MGNVIGGGKSAIRLFASLRESGKPFRVRENNFIRKKRVVESYIEPLFAHFLPKKKPLAGLL